MAVQPTKHSFSSSMETFMKTLDSRIESGASKAWEKIFHGEQQKSDLPGAIWGYGMFLFFIILIVICFSLSSWYKLSYGAYRSTADSVNALLKIRRQTLGIITSRPENKTSVCLSLKNKVVPYDKIITGNFPLSNWRPLTVRLAGYLGGINGPRDGVFDMDFGISNALFLGARSFIFDIDYNDEYPCAPILLYQDANGIHRSLNTGSIKDGMLALSRYAFNGDTSNYDPIIIVLYLRRVPVGRKQRNIFYTTIAKALSPLSSDHLGSTEQGNFHNCMSEKHLFTSEITNFQKKFIVLSNHSYLDLPTADNPKDNLDFWTNARFYMDTMGMSSRLSSVTPPKDSASVAYATIGDASQLLLLSDAQISSYVAMTNVYKIAISPLEDVEPVLTVPNLSKLLNKLGVNSIPLDVLRSGATEAHKASIVQKPADSLQKLADGTSAINTADPLSFWSYGGWSRKLGATEGFTNYAKAEPIPIFTIPRPVVPKKPSPSTNSNGGLVSIV